MLLEFYKPIEYQTLTHSNKSYQVSRISKTFIQRDAHTCSNNIFGAILAPFSVSEKKNSQQERLRTTMFTGYTIAKECNVTIWWLLLILHYISV